MSESLKIKITIADRVYPMTVPANQEEGLRKAAKKIEKVIKQFEQNYAVRDKQDVLAMCALQFAAKTEQNTIEGQEQIEKIREKLLILDEHLDKHL